MTALASGRVVADAFTAHRNAVISSIAAELPFARPGWLDGVVADLVADQPAHLRADISAGWWQLRLDLCEPATSHPLHRLDQGDALLLVAIGLVEDDVRFGALFAQLQDPLASRRPSVGLLNRLFPAIDGVPERCRELAALGLVEVSDADAPRAEQALRVPAVVWDLVRLGRPGMLPDGLRHEPSSSFPDLADVVVAPQQRAEIAGLPELMASGLPTALVVRGMAGSGRRTLLGSVARSLGRDVLVVDPPALARHARLLGGLTRLGGWLPVVRAAPAPGETVHAPALDGQLGLAIGRAGGVSGPGVQRPLTVVLAPVDAAQRRALWAAGVGSGADVDAIAEHFALPPGAIVQAAPLAAAFARRDGTAVRRSDVGAATRSLDRRALETVATFLGPVDVAFPPVLGAGAAAEFDTLLLRCKYRERLAHDFHGPLRATATRGVRALFSGPSGTGKTYAARHLAACLELDLFRIDLAAVVDKYVGETERNLERVLARAEELGVVLLLDEGDSLMAKRTDVGTANDRYANLETNFLLQRLETYDGIALVTTNAGSRIDAAFVRRMDVTIEFVPPDADQRWQILLAHLPRTHEVSERSLQDIARRCTLTGGQLRNAVLHAALLAIDGGTVIGDAELLAAVRREYRRNGLACPLRT